MMHLKLKSTFLSLAAALAMLLLSHAGFAQGTAMCTLAPAAYTPGQGVLVSIAVTPAASVSAQAAEDAPPPGWAVSSISDAGAWDAANGKVKWGPFFDAAPRTLSYTATPPAGTSGTKTFSGTASFDGASIPVTGARSIAQATATCSLTCTASVLASGTVGQPLSFSATATATNCTGSPSYIWTFGDGQTSALQNTSHTYTTAGMYNWALTVSQAGQTCAKSGSVPVTGGGSSTAVCSFSPAAYTPGQGVLVNIAVTPAPSVNSQAVEDAPPPGWTVGGISDSGAWDAVNGKVKWGPFFDAAPRTLSYTAAPPAGTSGTKTFSGAASFDGASIPVTGARSILQATATCSLTCTASVLASGTVGQPLSFSATATATNCTGSPSYIWTFGDGQTSVLQNTSHTYTASGTKSWTLTVTVQGQTCSKSGSVAVSAGGAGTAVCTLAPAAYTPGQGVLVSIAVTPAASVSAQATEDAPPPGWAVSSISDAGAWDAANGKVKWGPFFDAAPRTLSYTAAPPAGTSGTKTFSGTASFDGASIPVTGARSIAILCVAPEVMGVTKIGNPFRLRVDATHLEAGYKVYLARQSYPWSNIKVKSASQFVIKGAKADFPKDGNWVDIAIENPSGCVITIQYNRSLNQWRVAP